MKPKLLLCLALVLSAGLFACSNIARCADEPVGVRLTGHASFNGQAWPFEIVMEGYDRYYRIEWHPKPKDNIIQESKSANVPPIQVVLAIDDLYDSKDRAYVARRLWQGDKFRGVAADELRELVEYGHHAEEFLTPVSLEHFPTPCVIEWTDDFSPIRTMTYTIEKVEFTYQHNPQFWADARKKYFDFQDHNPAPTTTWHEQLSPAQMIATNALQEAKQNPNAAIAKLRVALAQFPLNRRLGAWNQSVLMGALWQIRGLSEKDELVDFFYRTVPLAPRSQNTRNGDLDNGPLCLLYAISSANRPETPELLAAIIADPQFDQTDAPTVVQMMEMSYEGFPVPKEVPLFDKNANLPSQPVELVRALGPQWRLVPLWCNILRRHYGLPEEKLPVWAWADFKPYAPAWGESVNDLQMACSLDTSNGVLHCFVRNAGTNAVAYNDFTFGYCENLSLEIRQPTGWMRVDNVAWPHGNGVKVTVPDDTKIRWLQPGQIITNTWVKRKTAEASMGRGSFLVGISAPDTFVVDLVDARWRWPDIILQQGSVEARVRQIFRSASTDDPYPYMHGPDIALYSPVFTMDCAMIQLFSDPRKLEK
jgi:hypothetical protein